MLYVCNAISIESHIHQFVEALNGLNIPHSDIDKYGR